MGKIIAIVLAVIIGLGAIAAFSGYVTWYNYGNRTETALVAKQTDVKQTLAKHGTQIAEMSQVNTMYKDDLKEVYTAAIEGRYGENGSGAVMQWIKEHNPNMDAALYVRLSQKIESNRDAFQNAQTELIDQKAQYQTSLGGFWSGFWLRVTGYPKINLDEIKVISSSAANKAYETGIDDGIQVRK